MNKTISIEVEEELGNAFESIVGENNISRLLGKYIRSYTIEHEKTGALSGRCTPYICEKCGLPPNEYGQDQCIANLGNVMNACCGHGTQKGYIQFDNSIIVRGYFEIVNYGDSGE